MTCIEHWKTLLGVFNINNNNNHYIKLKPPPNHTEYIKETEVSYTYNLKSIVNAKYNKIKK